MAISEFEMQRLRVRSTSLVELAESIGKIFHIFVSPFFGGRKTKRNFVANCLLLRGTKFKVQNMFHVALEAK